MLLEVCARRSGMAVRSSIVTLFEYGLLNCVHTGKLRALRCLAMVKAVHGARVLYSSFWVVWFESLELTANENMAVTFLPAL